MVVPPPTMAISEMPVGESQGAYGSLITMDQGAWRLEGIKMCTSHRLGIRDKHLLSPQPRQILIVGQACDY